MMSDTDNERSVLAEFPEMNPGPVCRLDHSGKVILANDAARSLFADMELEGNKWQELCPGLSASVWSSITSSQDPVQHEAEFGERCVLFTHVRAPSNSVVFVFGSDVTTLRRAERQLAEVARFPEMNPGPVLKLDFQGSVLLANEGARKIFGGEILGRSWLQICPGLTASFWEGVHRTEEPVVHEARVEECTFLFTHRCDPVSGLVFVFGADVTKQKLAERALRQSEKMATLGTLAAGVAHELNNPAAATGRAADHLVEAIARMTQSVQLLETDGLPPPGRQTLQLLEERIRKAALHPNSLDPVSCSDRELVMEEWLAERSIPLAEEIAPVLVALEFTDAELNALASQFGRHIVGHILQWVGSTFTVYSLLHEIGRGAERISEIVGALKGYSYVGQAPVRMIDLHQGLDNTLVILRSKLKHGITVRRDYQADIPQIVAWGGELNQVWTNLLDNAADALSEGGEITIRTRQSEKWVVVEIADTGPGIPEHLQSQIFDPFFTTKDLGKGTGLGLSTTYSIVTDLHKGEISLDSRPGRTVFTVRLPIDNPHLQHNPGRR